MRQRTLALAAIALGILAGGGPREGSIAGETGRSAMEAERDRVIQERIPRLGRESFPDDPDVTWHIRATVHKGSYSFVEVEPSPATVGYPRFKFVLRFREAGDPVLVGCYALDRKRWVLLFTVPGTPSDWQALQ